MLPTPAEEGKREPEAWNAPYREWAFVGVNDTRFDLNTTFHPSSASF